MSNMELFYSYAGVISIVMIATSLLVFTAHLFYQGIRRNQYSDIRQVLGKTMSDLDRYFDKTDKILIEDAMSIMGEVSRIKSPDIAGFAVHTIRQRNADKHAERLETRRAGNDSTETVKLATDTPFFTRREDRARVVGSGLKVASN